jgi:hypothetical protein
MTDDEALKELPEWLHNTYRAFVNDYKAACRRAAANYKIKGSDREYPLLDKGIVHHEVFIELFKSGRWRKIIP